MTVDVNDCRFESYSARIPHGPREYAAGIGVRVTHIPTGIVVETAAAARTYAIEDALNELTNLLAGSEQAALVEAISWGNANLYFADGDNRVNNDIDHKVAAAILRGLEHAGWKLTKANLND